MDTSISRVEHLPGFLIIVHIGLEEINFTLQKSYKQMKILFFETLISNFLHDTRHCRNDSHNIL